MMRRPRIEVDVLTLAMQFSIAIALTAAAMVMIALPTMIDQSVAVDQKNRLQKVLRDAYNSTAKY